MSVKPPLLMTAAQSNSLLTPTDLCLEVYSRAREPKELPLFAGDHSEVCSGEYLEGMKAKAR